MHSLSRPHPTCKAPTSTGTAKVVKGTEFTAFGYKMARPSTCASVRARRFSRQVTGGLQEYIEAVTFMHYLQTGQILSLDALNASLCKDGKPVRPRGRR